MAHARSLGYYCVVVAGGGGDGLLARSTVHADDPGRPRVQHVDAVRQLDAQGRASQPASVGREPVPRSARRARQRGAAAGMSVCVCVRLSEVPCY